MCQKIELDKHGGDANLLSGFDGLTVIFDGKVVPPRHRLVYEPTKESYNYDTFLPELFTNQIAVVRGSRLVGKMKPCFGGPNF